MVITHYNESAYCWDVVNEALDNNGFKSTFWYDKIPNYVPHFILQSESPSESALTALGFYMLCSLAFMVVALIQFAVAVILDRMQLSKGQKAENSRNDINRVGQKRVSNSRACKGTVEYKNTRKNLISMPSSIDEFDFATAWMYFFLILFFNGAYWAYHLCQ